MPRGDVSRQRLRNRREAMKASKLFAFTIGAGVCAALYAMQPSQPAATIFSVNDVLVRAKAQSETDDPFTVNGTSLNPSNDEASDPMSVD
jgi:hypothetical protein